MRLGQGSSQSLAIPVRLFPLPRVAPSFRSYDVSADGRFLINTLLDEVDGVTPSVTVVVNWAGTLEP